MVSWPPKRNRYALHPGKVSGRYYTFDDLLDLYGLRELFEGNRSLVVEWAGDPGGRDPNGYVHLHPEPAAGYAETLALPQAQLDHYAQEDAVSAGLRRMENEARNR